MKVGTKTTLIILATLIIGIIVGAAGSGVVNRWMPGVPPGPPPSADRFKMFLTRTIDPGPEQEEALNEILERYAERFADLTSNHATQAQALVDSLHEELDPILTEEQKARLKDRMQRLERFRDKRGRHEGRGPWKGRRPDGDVPPGSDPPPGP